MDLNKLNKYDDGSYTKYMINHTIEKNLRILSGILEGVKCDGIINKLEHSGIIKWMNENNQFKGKPIYRSVFENLETALEDNYLSADECKNLIWLCNNTIEGIKYHKDTAPKIQSLLGLINGITIDDDLNNREIEHLSDWLEENTSLQNKWPYDELYNSVTCFINKPSEHNRGALLVLCKELSGNENVSNLKSVTNGFYQIDPDITICEKTFCITGISKKYKRKEIAEKIELYGGYAVNSISKSVDYLVVCDNKNEHWVYTCYGRKVEEVTKLRKAGNPIVIVHEFDLYDVMETLISKSA
ncbi:MAG: BRCT domain-containing protein [Chitinophagaceae bacterium]|nr:BRCT domain-containing protein [Chitinophagaceae bacterium]